MCLSESNIIHVLLEQRIQNVRILLEILIVLLSYYFHSTSSLSSGTMQAERVTSIDFIVPAQDSAILKVGKLQYIRIVS